MSSLTWTTGSYSIPEMLECPCGANVRGIDTCGEPQINLHIEFPYFTKCVSVCLVMFARFDNRIYWNECNEPLGARFEKVNETIGIIFYIYKLYIYRYLEWQVHWRHRSLVPWWKTSLPVLNIRLSLWNPIKLLLVMLLLKFYKKSSLYIDNELKNMICMRRLKY